MTQTTNTTRMKKIRYTGRRLRTCSTRCHATCNCSVSGPVCVRASLKKRCNQHVSMCHHDVVHTKIVLAAPSTSQRIALFASAKLLAYSLLSSHPPTYPVLDSGCPCHSNLFHFCDQFSCFVRTKQKLQALCLFLAGVSFPSHTVKRLLPCAQTLSVTAFFFRARSPFEIGW